MSRLVADTPALLMSECLDALGDARHPLIVGEGSGRLAAAMREAGLRPTTWLRCLAAASDEHPRPWPSEGLFDAACVRLPKAKDALAFALHAAASRLPPGAPMALFGANAEGIRSAARHLDAVTEQVTTLAARRHARFFVGKRKAVIAGHKHRLEDWRRVAEVEIAGSLRPWVSYPGTFARGGIDDGTAFLLRHLSPLPGSPRVLDFAAGSGVIAATVATLFPTASIDMIEADTLALAAAVENVPGARAMLGDSLAAADTRYDLIVSNPPVHEGIAESRVVLDRLIAGAPRLLLTGGRLVIVVQRRIAVMDALTAAFGNARLIGESGRFSVAAAVAEAPRRR